MLRNIRPKVPLGPFLLKALPLLILLLAVEHYVGQQFLIGGDDQVDRCLPDKRIYLIDTYNKDIWRGDLIAFRAERMKPYFKDGQIIVKTPPVSPVIASRSTAVKPELTGPSSLKGCRWPRNSENRCPSSNATKLFRRPRIGLQV